MFPIVLTFAITFGVVVLKLIESFTEIQKARVGASGGSLREIESLRSEVANLKSQIDSLRETSTQYDLSFDSALQQAERRIEKVEREQMQIQRVGM